MYAVTPASVPAASPIATASEVLAPAAFATPPARAPAPAPNNAPFASGERFSHPVVKNRSATKIADEVLISPGFIKLFARGHIIRVQRSQTSTIVRSVRSVRFEFSRDKQKSENRAGDQETGNDVETVIASLGDLIEPADNRRSKETGQITQGIDPCDPGGCRRSCKERGRHRPEERKRGQNTHRGNCQPNQSDEGVLLEKITDDNPDCSQKPGRCKIQPAFAGPVRIFTKKNHRNSTKPVGNRR